MLLASWYLYPWGPSGSSPGSGLCRSHHRSMDFPAPTPPVPPCTPLAGTNGSPPRDCYRDHSMPDKSSNTPAGGGSMRLMNVDLGLGTEVEGAGAQVCWHVMPGIDASIFVDNVFTLWRSVPWVLLSIIRYFFRVSYSIGVCI